MIGALRQTGGEFLRWLGGRTRIGVAWVGFLARFFAAVVKNTPAAFRRLPLTVREILDEEIARKLA